MEIDETVTLEPVLKRHALMFTTPTCGACQLIKNYLKHIVDVDVEEIMLDDKTRDRFKEHGVVSAPTIIFYTNGKETARTEGFLSQGRFMDNYFLIKEL